MINKKIIPHTDHRLGRNINHDSRSRDFKYNTSGLNIVSAVHPRHISILNQGQVGSCVGNAGIGNLATDPDFTSLPTTLKYSLNETGAVKLYSDCETFDGDGPYPPNDNGTSGLTCAQVLLAAKQISGYTHTFSLNDALLALGQTPIMVGSYWYNSMFTPASDGKLIITPSSGIAGGHEYEVREIDAVKQIIWIDNSWGTSWGVQGRAYMTFTELGNLLTLQGDVTILTPLNLLPSVQVTVSPSNVITAGTTVTFTATPLNAQNPTYKWYLNGLSVGTNSTTYTSSTLTDGSKVYCTMVSGTSTLTSNTINITVNSTPVADTNDITLNAAFKVWQKAKGLS